MDYGILGYCPSWAPTGPRLGSTGQAQRLHLNQTPELSGFAQGCQDYMVAFQAIVHGLLTTATVVKGSWMTRCVSGFVGLCALPTHQKRSRSSLSSSVLTLS